MRHPKPAGKIVSMILHWKIEKCVASLIGGEKGPRYEHCIFDLQRAGALAKTLALSDEVLLELPLKEICREAWHAADSALQHLGLRPVSALPSLEKRIPSSATAAASTA